MTTMTMTTTATAAMDNGVFNDDKVHDNDGDDNTHAAYCAGARSRDPHIPRS